MLLNISTSKSKKQKSARQVLLSALMGHISGDAGTELAGLYAAGDAEGFEAALAGIAKTMANELREGK